jgi:hypothetical protein
MAEAGQAAEGPKTVLLPCVIESMALGMPSTTGLTPCQLPFGQPATFPLTVGAAANVTLKSKTPRPLWSALPRSADAEPIDGTGFCPGDELPPLFWHVYRTVPPKVIVAAAGLLPKPLPSPAACHVNVLGPAAVTSKNGPECHVTAARAIATNMVTIMSTRESFRIVIPPVFFVFVQSFP